MAVLPEKTTLQRINALVDKSLPRPHLGGSVIGHQCRRYLLYSFRWAYQNKIESKLNRIFRIGDSVEDLIIKDLERVGIKHSGAQDQVDGFMGHCGGSIDGLLNGVPEYPEETLLFEAKSANHTNFLEVQRKGVQVAKPIYFAQTQIYMGKLGLSNTLFAMMDKNTSELYIEFIEYDEYEFERLLEIEQDVVLAKNVNEFMRVSNNRSWYACKYCAANGVCHSGVAPEKNCRTCQFSVPVVGGKWQCEYFNAPKELSVEEQEAGCIKYELSEIFRGAEWE
jgi:hypothetical protein